jgi:hypothetical protein
MTYTLGSSVEHTVRKRPVIVFAVGTSVSAAVLGTYLMLPRTPINEGNYDKIQVGMSLAEVEALLGGPARDESRGPLRAVEPGEGNPEDRVRTFKERFIYFRFDDGPEDPEPCFWITDWLMVRVE